MTASTSGESLSSREFKPGFRFSRLDGAVLFFGLWISLDTAAVPPFFWFGMSMAFVIVNYFIFCNVVRMSRKLEFVWAIAFVDMALANHFFGIPSWPVTFAMAILLGVVFIILEIRKASYHGMFWRHVNPGLPEWWAKQREEAVSEVIDVARN